MKYIIIITSLLALSFSAKGAENKVDSLVPHAVEVENEVEIIEPDSLWDQANTAYINSQYGDAIELYNSIEKQGLMSDKLYFNLGNAHYKNEDIAKSILYYQKALLISPNDEDIKYNLQIVQSQIKDQIEVIPEIFVYRWNRSISHIFNGTGWTIISLIALSIFFGAAIVFLLSNSIAFRKSGFGVGLFAIVIFIASTLYALGERDEIINHNQAVVMSRSISIKSSPDRSATDLFMLHSGTTVKIIREIDDWSEIVIADGKKGWIENKRIERI